MAKEDIDEFLSYLGEVAYCNGALLKDLNKESENIKTIDKAIDFWVPQNSPKLTFEYLSG